jgi:carbamoyltransferase
MTSIVGINAYHGDSSACLVVDGELVAAVEEERFRRIKHWAGFPSQAIAYCLEAGGLTLGDVDHVAINRDHKSNWGPRLKFVASQRPSLDKLVERMRARAKVKTIADELAEAFPGEPLRAEIHNVQHHRAHLASTALVSPFSSCVAVSVDQFGDFGSAAWGFCREADVKVEGSVYFPHSLGTFYSALTQFIGFPHYGDEYKLMGLAPYGEPRFLPEMRKILKTHTDGTFELELRYFRHHTERIYFEWDGGVPKIDDLFSPALEHLLGPRRKKGEPLTDRHRDMARSVQARYEEAFFNLLAALHSRYHVDDVALAGGCAMNSVANGKIYLHTPFKRAYIQPAAGDAGGALGAAFAIWYERHGGPRRFVMDHACWGPEADEASIDALLEGERETIEAAGCTIAHIEDEGELCLETAKAVADGLVVGWFQGRLEWGPRALGNRSIVCDPRRADMKEILNVKIKRRESFRPFAPSVLREHVKTWFEQDDEVPFMMKVFQIVEDKRALIPAVTHKDGSGRLQTVRSDVSPLYHRLISAFHELTGVPLVLNTSFNENEPVVCKPEEALACFLRTKMDVLVLGNRMVRRASSSPSEA